MAYHKQCLCHVTWHDDVGRYDTVTREWLPDAPNTIVRFHHHEDCPMHRLYYLFQEIRIVEDLGDGWVLCQWLEKRKTPHGPGIWKQWRDQIHMGKQFGPQAF